MLTCYMEVSNEKIDEMKQMDIDDLMYAVGELSESEEHKTYELDDMCDGLHFLINKVSAKNQIKGNLLSEAILGTEILAGEEAGDRISYVDYETAHDILNSLEELDLDNLIDTFDPNEFADNSIYPNIWINNDKSQLQSKLNNAFNNLKEFYSDVTGISSGLIVCIY